MIEKDAIDILKSIQDGLEETRFLERCSIDMAIEALKHVQELEYMIKPNEAVQKMRDVLYYEKGKADARPHGEWEIHSEEGRIYHLFCSECKKDAEDYISGSENWWMNSIPNFCPNCGADMREGEADVL